MKKGKEIGYWVIMREEDSRIETKERRKWGNELKKKGEVRA